MNAFRRIRGALGMGLTWGAAWAVSGVLIGASSLVFTGLPWDAFFEVFDAPLPTLAIPGFVGGVLFSIVLGIAARRRRFDELSLPQFAALGAFGGFLLSLIPLVLLYEQNANADGVANLWRTTAIMSVPFIVLSALSAAGSLLLARRAEDRASDQADVDVTFGRSASPGVIGEGGFAQHDRSAQQGERIRPDQNDAIDR